LAWGKRGAAAVTVLYGAAAGGLAGAGREQLRKNGAQAADTLGRDVQPRRKERAKPAEARSWRGLAGVRREDRHAAQRRPG
jgi:hypothetical protein